MPASETTEAYLSQPYSRVLIPDPSGGYFAEVLEFPGCFAQGETADEAIANLEDAMAGWIAATLEEGQAIPPPQASQGYSGHVALRLPKSLHREAARRAQMEGTSLNQYLVTAVAARIGAEDFVDRLAERLASRSPEGVLTLRGMSAEPGHRGRRYALQVGRSRPDTQPTEAGRASSGKSLRARKAR